MVRRFICAAALVVAATLSFGGLARAAADLAVISVESVLSPAWVERADGRRDALAAGMALSNREKVHTALGGRALLRLSDGSGIKLGEGATLALDDLARKVDAQSNAVVSASLDVVRGAFRFTTGLLGKPNAQRDVRVKVNVITAGIRGTDVWGKSHDERDILCLIEGRVSVNHGASEFVMQDALSFYIVPRVGQAQPPSPAPAAQVKAWAAETEINPRSGAARRGGRFSVTVSSWGDEGSASAQRDKLRDSGYPAEVSSVGEGPYARHEVVVRALSESADAVALAGRLRAAGYPQARPAR